MDEYNSLPREPEEETNEGPRWCCSTAWPGSPGWMATP